MQYKHKELILAKVDNPELVVFWKLADGKWMEYLCNGEFPKFSNDQEYYLCLPQHKDVCLAWLNGASIQDYFEGEWSKCKDYDGSPWSWHVEVMNEECHLRVMPKKVTYYGAFDTEYSEVMYISDDIEYVTDSINEASTMGDNNYQLISFEVEV